MAIEVAPLSKVSTASGVAGAVAAYATSETFLVVVLPIVAAWFAMVGLGIIHGKSTKTILRQVFGSILLGGVVGISAVFCIGLLGLKGEVAAFITLSIAMVPVAVARAVGRVGPRAIDAALSTIGLQKKAIVESNKQEAEGEG